MPDAPHEPDFQEQARREAEEAIEDWATHEALPKDCVWVNRNYAIRVISAYIRAASTAGAPAPESVALQAVAQAAESALKIGRYHDCVPPACGIGYGNCNAYYEHLAVIVAAEEKLRAALDALPRSVASEPDEKDDSHADRED